MARQGTAPGARDDANTGLGTVRRRAASTATVAAQLAAATAAAEREALVRGPRAEAITVLQQRLKKLLQDGEYAGSTIIGAAVGRLVSLFAGEAVLAPVELDDTTLEAEIESMIQQAFARVVRKHNLQERSLPGMSQGWYGAAVEAAAKAAAARRSARQTQENFRKSAFVPTAGSLTLGRALLKLRKQMQECGYEPEDIGAANVRMISRFGGEPVGELSAEMEALVEKAFAAATAAPAPEASVPTASASQTPRAKSRARVPAQRSATHDATPAQTIPSPKVMQSRRGQLTHLQLVDTSAAS